MSEKNAGYMAGYITLAEAAKELHVSKQTLKNYARDEEIPMPTMRDYDGVEHVRLEDAEAAVKLHHERNETEKAAREAAQRADKPEGDYLTARQAAKIVGVSPATVRNWINDSISPLPAIRNGKTWYVEQSTFMAYLASREITPINAPTNPSTAYDARLNSYPALASIDSDFVSLSAASQALGIPSEIVKVMVLDPYHPVPHIEKNKRFYIHKASLASRITEASTQYAAVSI